jgi:hypothetical protein
LMNKGCQSPGSILIYQNRLRIMEG